MTRASGPMVYNGMHQPLPGSVKKTEARFIAVVGALQRFFSSRVSREWTGVKFVQNSSLKLPLNALEARLAGVMDSTPVITREIGKGFDSALVPKTVNDFSEIACAIRHYARTLSAQQETQRSAGAPP